MKIVIPNERPLSLNKFYAGIHWTKRKKEADRVHKLVRAFTPKNTTIIAKRVDILITAYFKDRPLDASNIFLKIYEDGLKGVVIADDSRAYVRCIGGRSEIDKFNPRVEIELIEVEEI